MLTSLYSLFYVTVECHSENKPELVLGKVLERNDIYNNNNNNTLFITHLEITVN